MRIVYRGGIAFRFEKRRKPAEPEAVEPQPQSDYQGLRYSRYGVRYIP